MKVLSLFDGISCARVALERAGIPVEVYYASEVDKYAMQISEKNYPDIVRLGNVTEFTYSDGNSLKFDLLIGGSPCQDLSIAKKNRKGLDGARSGLFWEYVRILKEVKPKYFILENVASMPKEAKEIISEALGVQPIMINAALVSAQNRKRLFWTNIPNVTLPEDRGILLKDIIEGEVDSTILYEYRNRINERWRKTSTGKSPTMRAAWGTGGNNVPFIEQTPRGYNKGGEKALDGKTPTLSSSSWEHNNHLVMGKTIRKLTPVECERLQGLPEIEKSCIIKVCLDNQNNLVDVENQNLKLPNVVWNVEKNNSQETALSAIQNLNISSQQINKPVQSDVLILCEENKVEIHSQGKLLVSVSGAELKNNAPHLKSIEDFVRLVVGLTSTVEETTPFGKVVLHQKNKCSVVVENGNNVVTLYGNEIMRLAKDAENDSITLKKLLKSTTSDHFGQANREQAIITLFSYVASVIVGYIPKEMLNQNTLTFEIKTKVGYTHSMSNTQRYKTLGNAFNVDVIAHILSFIK